MKVVIGYPPLDSKKVIPQISQNRQFQWTAGGPLAYTIYPVVPAYAATMLKQAGHHVFWLDGIAERWTLAQWYKEVKRARPDLLVVETKTPVVKKHWQIIDKVKRLIGNKALSVLVGDHVTALPEESFARSQVDYVLTGGDWDFLLVNLVKHLEHGEKLEPGIYRKVIRSEGKKAVSKIINSGNFKLSHDLNKLPLIDRNLTKWHLYAYRNSNFYRAPGAYTMFGRDCWWGKCSFCSWTTLFPGEKYRIASVNKALDEIDNLVNRYQVKEVMDDSGTFAHGDWLREFCRTMIKKGYHKKIRISGNMRFNAGLTQQDYNLMGKAGFQFMLYGLESANQATLNRLNKNLQVEQIEPVLTMAKKAGLWPHITVMVGYPWESEREVKKTVRLVKDLFVKGLANSMQATIAIPYPGTPLFTECRQKGWLKTTDWNYYDMRQPIMKTKLDDDKLLAIVRELYHVSIWNKTFLINTIKRLRRWDGIKHVGFQGLKYFGKIWEVGKKYR